MAKTAVLGVFEERKQAEEALEALKREGFREGEISVVGKDDRRGEGNGDQGLGRGAAWGAGIGTGAGILATAGALTIPGIGPLVALGPLATVLGGAATGGVSGALADWGIPEQRGRDIENRVREGRFVTIVDANGKADKARDVLKQKGAREVEKYER